jgi:hypothetical protein
MEEHIISTVYKREEIWSLKNGSHTNVNILQKMDGNRRRSFLICSWFQTVGMEEYIDVALLGCIVVWTNT